MLWAQCLCAERPQQVGGRLATDLDLPGMGRAQPFAWAVGVGGREGGSARQGCAESTELALCHGSVSPLPFLVYLCSPLE